jgi:hypothetical protein
MAGMRRTAAVHRSALDVWFLQQHGMRSRSSIARTPGSPTAAALWHLCLVPAPSVSDYLMCMSACAIIDPIVQGLVT